MRYNQNNQLPYQRRRSRWISFLFPLVFLLIFAFTQSLAGLFASLAIIVLLWLLIAAVSSSSRTWNAPPIQSLPVQQPESAYMPGAEAPYEQGYIGTGNTSGQAQQVMPQVPGASEENDRLAQLILLGDLYHAGKLTDDEFVSQKQKILQAGATKEAAEPEATPMVISGTQYEEQPQVPYPQE